MGSSNYIVFLFLLVAAGLLFIIYRWLTTKRNPQKSNEMLSTLPGLESLGIHRDANGYSGIYNEYPVYIYATSTPQSFRNLNNSLLAGDKFQVWLITAPEPGQLKGIGGFFGKYLVAGEKPGYAMVGFVLNFRTSSDPAGDIRQKLDELSKILKEAGVKPYPIQ